MSEKDKGFSFKKLFIRDIETPQVEAQIQNTDASTRNTQAEYIPNRNTQVLVDAHGQPLVADFVQRLQNLINQNNQTGFDFLEFTESLFEEKQNPSPEVYQTVFRIAQKIDKSLTSSRLLESAKYYKDLVQRTTETEISKGIAKKQSLQTEKENERTNLDNSLKETRTKIQQLTRQIQELQNQELTLNNQLLAIDQKYESNFVDIDRKINAIRSAEEQVIVSIVDIEAGIKSHLS
jgi:uncharacterized protein YaaR (DUF327 family)